MAAKVAALEREKQDALDEAAVANSRVIILVEEEEPRKKPSFLSRVFKGMGRRKKKPPLVSSERADLSITSSSSPAAAAAAATKGIREGTRGLEIGGDAGGGGAVGGGEIVQMGKAKMAGKGRYVWKNCESYEGEWLNQLAHGYGVLATHWEHIKNT